MPASGEGRGKYQADEDGTDGNRRQVFIATGKETRQSQPQGTENMPAYKIGLSHNGVSPVQRNNHKRYGKHTVQAAS